MLLLEQPATSHTPNSCSPLQPGVIPFPSRDLSHWARQVDDCLARGRAAIRELAQTLFQARSALSRGEWSNYWCSDEAPFSKRKGEMLVRVGKWLQQLNANTCSHLPSGWRVLYILSRLSPETVLRLVETGAINHELGVKAAKELVANVLGKAPDRAPPKSGRASLVRLCDRFQQAIGSLSREELRYARVRLAELAAAIGSEDNLRIERSKHPLHIDSSCVIQKQPHPALTQCL